MTDQAPRCGYIALLGAPNAGKSTLMNQMVGTKVSIVTPKPQTTRSRVLGIVMAESAQLVFVDTPGIFAPRRRLDRAMVAAAWEGAHDADLVVLLIDATRGVTGDVRRILDGLRDSGHKDTILGLNKIDLVPRENLLGLASALNEEGLFSDIFMISAMNGDGVGDLKKMLAERVPDGPWLFPEDQLTDMPNRLLAAEITREKIYLMLHQELPYAVAVETEDWQDKDDGSARIAQVVYVQRPGQKAIVLGHGGRTIKAIGASARRELELLFERRIHLFLYVKVRENWTEDPSRFSEWGLNYNV